MNRYKKELQLRGYSNLPTMKDLETKNGKYITYFDDYNITSVKKALEKMMSKNRKKKNVKVIMKYKYIDDEGNLYKKHVSDIKFAYNNSKEILDYIKLMRNKNEGKSSLIVGFDKKNIGIYKDFNCVVDYDVMFYNTNH